ncbi:AAA family ATPase [Pyxidicoccus caerfyrddinensis]|uniref:AAA family ATPase n=1 Tax=Pyxidicoccus caerfyrddinensis TaxID=2709663 RepID=UPI0013D9FA75|nr:AAA family ATPase [Pyxidicoccus caerfyrddinensis]
MLELPGYQEVHSVYSGPRYEVFRVRTDSGASHVVKTVRPGPLAEASADMLRHEHAMLLELRDVPGVSRALGLVDLAGLPALVLEDAGPCSLQDWLRRGPPSVETFLELAICIADVLGALHRKHVIHRDLNPANLVVAPDARRLVLIDFDLSTRVPGLVQAMGIPGGLEGTLQYIAPEQTGRMNRLVDHRADLYALGATFYEMLTGEAPFLSADPGELVHALLAKPPVPPAERAPQLPAVLSDLVMKLLAKVPEERYQSARTLAADLREAARRWHESGAIAPFELGRRDVARELVIPDTLFGRERELEAMEAALARVRAGASARVLVKGPAGSGKSSLARALHGRVEGGGRFLCGGCAPLRGHVPYAPWVEAFRGLVAGLQEEAPQDVSALRGRVQQALGTRGRVLTALLPGLEALTGEQPPVVALGPKEAESRFHLVFQSFLHALATRERPLVLWLDDLQWADAASLALLERVVLDPDLHHLLLLGAYRPEEADPAHPLARTLESLQAAGVHFQSLELGPLDLSALESLCGDTLRCGPERASPLARCVLEKTAGNPFFVHSFLRHLHRTGLLAFDVERGTWEWDLDRIEQAEVTENVLELMLAAIFRLPERTQRLLKAAACMRGPVDLWLLAAVVGAPVEDTASDLWSAIREGLLVPVGEVPHFHPTHEDAAGPQASLHAAYRFVHGRIQQAAYSLLAEDERRRLHRDIGLQLWAEASEPEEEQRLFEVVDHLNQGAERGDAEAERHWLAGLNLRAGRKSRDASAFDAALAYFLRARELLTPEAWHSQRERMFHLHRDAAECAQLTGDGALAESLLETAMAHAATPVEKADLFGLRMSACTLRRAHAEALHWGREGLRLLGVALPEGDATEAFRAEFAKMEEFRRGRSDGELLAAPPMTDPAPLACMRLLMHAGVAAWFSDPPLFSFIYTRMLNLSLEHGNSVYSAYAYVCFGIIFGEVRGDFASGHPFSRLGVELSRRSANPREECRVLSAFLFYMHHWREPLRSALPLLRRGIDAGLESGEPQFVAYLLASTAFTRLRMGTELGRVRTEVESGLAFDRKSGQHAMADVHLAIRQAVRCLQGRTRERAGFDDDGFDARAFEDSARRDPTILCQYEVLRLQTSYLVGDLAGAREWARVAEAHLPFVRWLFTATEHAFYAALTLAASEEDAPAAERESLVERLEHHHRRLGAWAESNPGNFRHRHLLVSAELARVKVRHNEAMTLYDEAIDLAREEGFPQDEALANALAGRLYHSLGRRRVAALYLRAAREGFARWGAKDVVAMLQEEFPDVQAPEAGSWERPVTPTGEEPRGAALDLLSIMKAAQMLSGEMALERLLEKLMAVCLEAAGAQRGALVLESQGALVLHAVGMVSEPVELVREPLAEARQVPGSLIRHAYRTGDLVVLGDAAHQGRFVSDAYVARERVKSALAVPIRRHARTVGVLYLENNLATHAFKPDRVQVLQLLSSQMAISLENSFLFEERKRAEASVRFLAECSMVLAESLDFEATLMRVARLASPVLGDGCAIDVVDEDGSLRRVVTTHSDPTLESVSRELQRDYPPDWNSPQPSVWVMKTKQPLLLPELTDTILAPLCRDARHARLIRSLRARTLMAVPLLARGRTLGAITFVCASPGRRYNCSDLALAQDLARRAAISLDNARLYRESQQAIHLRDEFLSIAAHELYTPITALQLSVQGLARGGAAPSPETVLRTARTTQAQTRRLAHLVDELLDVSRIETGRLHLHLEPVDLAAVVQDVVEGMKDAFTRAQSPLNLHVDACCAGRWDRVRLEQVVTNLLSNALKFGAGRPIEVRLEEVDAHARLDVVDQGIGIPPARLPFIFGRFERAVSSREYGGLGLGLFIVREIVSALGGRVSVESTEGQGSRFTVELPRTGPPDVRPAPGEAPEPVAHA